MMKQSDAVVAAVQSVFTENEVVPETGKWTSDQKSRVYLSLLSSFKEGQWIKSSGGTDDAAVLKYIPGLVNNHVRKDKRLNGGAEYVAKRPGSRTGSGDESLKAMRTLYSLHTDPAVKAEIQVMIDARLEELKPKADINVSALPEALRHLIPQ